MPLQARTSHYHLLVQRIGSWGFVVAQYNTPFLRIFNDTIEVWAACMAPSLQQLS